ncbi:hypothetical protein SBRCBS47491_007938 [Sporothrix bragantina]|uniref:Nucleolar 27S pre-rRNA processing Urb2/Npa2 C-terminal domain-containing protein n=1 Tax=Sporothrix bragantina TaxID=671064 RepID=A0ABP0CHA5_9PEZI
MAEASLLKVARSLDQSGPETVVSKLQRLWDALAATSASTAATTTSSTPAANPEAGRFHASEEVALRWLLKNMHAAASGPASPEVETLRRWPLTWRILACIFGRIPLFSLAKSLADRRFVAVLQQTAKDLATPIASVSDDQSSRKRKRWQDAQFDLTSLREPQHCVTSAAALFEALRVLLARLDDSHDGKPAFLCSPFDHMGAEHIKSFFSVPASDANILLEPLIKTCRLALSKDSIFDARNDTDANCSGKSNLPLSLDGQASWISTFATLWDLRLQGPNDVFDVSSRLASDGLAMLGCLLNISPVSLSAPTSQLDPELQRRWSIGLGRFFTNNLVLPARSLFLNNKDVSAISMATSNATAKADADGYIARASSFLYLALKAPRLLSGSGATSKGSESWLATVFETIREPLMSTNNISEKAKNNALARLLDMAAENNMAPSTDSLEQVCEKLAIRDDDSETDWELLASVARCNADVFLLSEKGENLLKRVLQKLNSPGTMAASTLDTDFATSFLISLAHGFAKNRDVAGFITHWYTGIGALGHDLTRSPRGYQAAWLAEDLRAAVAATLQSSVTEGQLLSMIAQVEQGISDSVSSSGNGKENDTSRSVAQLVIFDALSASIHSEALEDAVQTKMVDSVLGLDLSSKLPSNILAIRWRLIRRTLAWVGFSEAECIWAAVKAPLESLSVGSTTKKQSTMLDENMFEAFIACFSIWMALKFGGQTEQDARETTWAFFKGFQGELLSQVNGGTSLQTELLKEVARQTAASDKTSTACNGVFDTQTSATATYLTWMLCGSSRFIDEMVKSSKEPSHFLETLLSWQSHLGAGKGATIAENSLSTLVFGNVTALQNQKITSSIAESQVKRLEDAADNKNAQLQSAANALLQMPTHLLSRTQRERIVTTLLPTRPKMSETSAFLSVRDYVLVLDLLTKVTRDRAFGDVDFDRLVYLGETVQATAVSEFPESALGIFDRFQQVAKAVIKSSASKTDCAISKSIPLDIQLVLYAAKLSTLKDFSSSTTEATQLAETKEKLAPIVVKQLLAHIDSKEDVDMSGTADDNGSTTNNLPLQLLLAFNAAMADDLQPQLVQQKKFGSLIKKAKKEAGTLCAGQQKIGWKWKAFIARYTRGQESRPSRDVLFQGLFLNDNTVVSNETAMTAASVLLDSDLLRDYLAGETAGYDQEALLDYIEEVINALDAKGQEDASTVGQLLAIQYLLGRLLEMPSAATAKTAGGFHLGVVHSKLAQRLPHTRIATECKVVAQTLRTLLVDDKAAAAMGQWNIDATLSAATSVVSGTGDGSNGAVHASVTAYSSACQLVEAVLKRHRVRLEGRFHLMVSTLQALLVRLVAGHQDELKQRAISNSGAGTASASGAIPSWAAQAKRFSRLLELICEPSTAAVTMMTLRKGGGGPGGAAPLHSATDAAKRSAGQHMYLVLMTYIKLQTEGVSLSVSVRDALEPGFFSILTITPDEMRRLLNGAVDANGQTLFKRLYSNWLKSGKWKGV